MDTPATKADLEALKVEVKTAIADVKADLADVKGDVASLSERFDMLRSEMRRRHNDIIERLESREKKLLQVFYTYTELNRERIAGVESAGAIRPARRSGASSALPLPLLHSTC